MSIPELPRDTPLQQLAEGAANVVYRFVLRQPNYSNDEHVLDEDATPRPSSTSAAAEQLTDHAAFLAVGRLLRLGKALRSRVCNQQSHRYFHGTLESLFPAEYLISLDLIKLPTELIDSCNNQLEEDERFGRRPAKRAGCYLARDEPYGLLITDMTPDLEKREVLIEFKPKWLVQSPTSPPGSRRCRTCALKARRNAGRRLKGKKEEIFLCPLDLASQDIARIKRAVGFLIPPSITSEEHVGELGQRLVEFLLNNPIVPRLQQLQRDLDPLGVLYADVSSSQFLTAMTLRDCTLYLKMRQAGQGPIEARLGDLDLKSPDEGKAEYWRAVEKELIDGGWYTGTEDDPQTDRSWCDLT
ncbi:MAG: Inositol-pentakisphosphate 2-kinase [Candelina mexicana]|nr:MAG: Inositol-pentakisphosphate 2-kinase [Candelina mexicana]